MSFLPPGEKIVETKKCKISGKEFFVTDRDLEFYDKISPLFAGQKYLIPSPTLCPDERQRRRMAFRNELKLYHRKCDKTGNQIISIYSSDKPYTVYDQKVWWSDDWSPNEFGIDFDFNETFFKQFQSLQLRVPRVNLFAKNCENAEFTNHTDHIKNSYLSVDVADSENIYYSRWILNSRNCFDCYRLENCELCYQSQYSVDSYLLRYCLLCSDCSDCLLCENMKNCQNCILCYGLVGKQYHIMNQEYSPEIYAEKKREILAQMSSNMSDILGLFKKFSLQFAHQALILRNTESVFGDMIDNSKLVIESFDISNAENLKYCYEATGIKDSYDVFESGFNCEQQYECYASNRTSFSSFCTIGYDNSFNWYSDLCNNSQHCFSSVGLRQQHHCILNKNYSVHEYESLCGRIIEHMQSTGEWGEFFPHELSPFCYDETVAAEHFPLSENDVREKGWNWKGEEETSSYHGRYYTTLPIREYSEKSVGYETAQKNIDALLSGILECQITKKPFKIIKQELAFYVENDLPIPMIHPNQRHLQRLAQRNSRTLYERICAECDKNIITTYSPERTEKVVCEECYHKLIY
ncbi:hypothetical protein KA057_02440 [Candidatus Gracilibacteria bacterium]|nr:hypothetical protein [Candidatus Gracilibacteria bacterium]